jgi:putative transferase (TIGR04331 family)
MTSDLFMAYAAHHVSRGTKFVRIQHGGVMGSARVSTFEEMQRASGDAYLSWGWKAADDARVKPIGHVLRPWPRRTSTRGSMLTLVTVAPPPYSYWMHSGVQGAGYPAYFRLQAEFGRRLPIAIRRRLLVRLYREDYGWKCAEAWRSAVPEATLDSETIRLAELAPRTKLMVATYNSTAFLESFAAGVPTLLLWDPRVFAIRHAANGAFERLRAAGILHHSAEEAARQVADIWDDPAAWWQSDPVAGAIAEFCDLLNWRTPGVLGRIRKVLRELAHDRSRNEPPGTRGASQPPGDPPMTSSREPT